MTHYPTADQTHNAIGMALTYYERSKRAKSRKERDDAGNTYDGCIYMIMALYGVSVAQSIVEHVEREYNSKYNKHLLINNPAL